MDYKARLTRPKGAHHPSFQQENLDPNKRYLSVRILSLKAMVDFVNARDDEYLTVTFSFLKTRYHTKTVQATTDPVFDETFIFDFIGENDQIKFDPSMLLKLN